MHSHPLRGRVSPGSPRTRSLANVSIYLQFVKVEHGTNERQWPLGGTAEGVRRSIAHSNCQRERRRCPRRELRGDQGKRPRDSEATYTPDAAAGLAPAGLPLERVLGEPCSPTSATARQSHAWASPEPGALGPQPRLSVRLPSHGLRVPSALWPPPRSPPAAPSSQPPGPASRPRPPLGKNPAPGPPSRSGWSVDVVI